MGPTDAPPPGQGVPAEGRHVLSLVDLRQLSIQGWLNNPVVRSLIVSTAPLRSVESRDVQTASGILLLPPLPERRGSLPVAEMMDALQKVQSLLFLVFLLLPPFHVHPVPAFGQPLPFVLSFPFVLSNHLQNKKTINRGANARSAPACPDHPPHCPHPARGLQGDRPLCLRGRVPAPHTHARLRRPRRPGGTSHRRHLHGD